MSTMLEHELKALVENVHERDGIRPSAQLWREGRSRRRWAAARSAVVVAVAAAVVALVVWPGVATTPSPAPPAAAPPARTFPSVVPNPHFAPSIGDAHRPMVATYVDGQALYAVDDRGQVWRAPSAPGFRQYAALSPNGRYATDGWAVYDFQGGSSTSLTGAGHFPADSLRTGAAWSPDSSHFAVVATGTSATVAIGTVGGALVAAPTVPSASGTAALVFTSWLDERTLLIVIPASPSPDDQTKGARLLAYTWTMGAGAWAPRGTLQLPVSSSAGDVDANIIGTSPDGQTLALPVAVDAGPNSGVALVTWRLPVGDESATAQPVTVQATSPITVDGITWRGRDLVVVRGGVTSVVESGQVLSRAGSGESRPTSWRVDAFDGVPYYNTWAVWRDRLFVWAVILGSLVLIVLVLRLARPLARHAGLLGDRYSSPFPIEARWIFSLYGGTSR